MIPVILSGGSGSRLWPVSRASYPKQFCEFFEESLLAKTVRRLQRWGSPRVVTVRSLSVLTERCIQELVGSSEGVYYEPRPRNTAPAIALLCKNLIRTGVNKEEIIGVFPADHMIRDEERFAKAVDLASECAVAGQIVTIGIRPDYPATGFGYIHCETSEYKRESDLIAHTVKSFCEKPELNVAKEFLQKGNYYWNAGMFVFRLQDMCAAFEAYLPDMWQAFQSTDDVSAIYDQIEEVSLDYGVMERASNQVCVPCDIGWSDLGSWDDLSKELSGASSPKQELASVVEVNATNNFVRTSGVKTVGLVGVEGLVVVDTNDALLIAKKEKTQDVKGLVEKLKEKKSSVAKEHVFEYRPWGKYEILAEDDTFKSKVITVNPGSQLSYQSHEHRSELWMIVEGRGEVVLDGEVVKVEKDNFVHIPKTTKHRMRNTSPEPLRFVEIQTGTYFGEDDITRYEDDYNRV